MEKHFHGACSSEEGESSANEQAGREPVVEDQTRDVCYRRGDLSLADMATTATMME